MPDGDPTMACPVCGRKPDPALHPFCSRRCADVDLHRWLTGAYAIPADDDIPDTDPHSDAGQHDDRTL